MVHLGLRHQHTGIARAIRFARWWVYLTIGAVVAADLWLFTVSPLAAAVVAGVLSLVLLAERWPALFLISAFAAMPYQQSLGGADSHINFSVVDVIAGIMALALPAILMRRRGFTLGPAAVPLFLFLGIEALSSAISWDGLSTGVSIARMAVATLVAVAIYANVDTRLRTALNCFNAYLLSISVLAIFSVLAFATGGVHASEYTLGMHKNALGPTYGCGIVIALGMLLLEKPSFLDAHDRAALRGRRLGVGLRAGAGVEIAVVGLDPGRARRAGAGALARDLRRRRQLAAAGTKLAGAC